MEEQTMNRPIGSDLKRAWVEYAVELEAKLEAYEKASATGGTFADMVIEKHEATIAELRGALATLYKCYHKREPTPTGRVDAAWALLVKNDD